MAIAFDQISSSSGSASLSWTHTPVGTPKGVLVLIYGDEAVDDITSVSYGSVALSEVTGSPQTRAGASSDIFAVHAFFLGSSVPTGAQTVSVTHAGGTSAHRAACITLTANGDTAIEDTSALNAATALNPNATLTIDEESFCALVFGSGVSAVTGTTPVTGWTSRYEDDFGVCGAGIYTKNATSSTNVSAQITMASDDIALLAVAVKEVANSAPTIAANTADGQSFSTATPALEFTGSDANSDSLRYQIVIESGIVAESEYADTNYSENCYLYNGGDTKDMQSFESLGGKLYQAKFQLAKGGSPTGSAYAKLYAHSGTFGTSSVPGTLLATSDAFDVTALTGTRTMVTFTFSGANRYQMTAGTRYCISVEYSGGDGGNYLICGTDATSPTHPGNRAYYYTSWNALSGHDLPFAVISKAVHLDKLSGTDAGFANTVTGGDTDPFNAGEKVSYTVQAGDALPAGTYSWRVRAIDPAGSNTWSSYTAARSFTVTGGAPTNTGNFFVFFG